MSADRLDELAALKDGWDSYGAPPIAETALALARRAWWVPTSSGGLQWELHAETWDIEIDISPTGHVSIFFDQTSLGASS